MQNVNNDQKHFFLSLNKLYNCQRPDEETYNNHYIMHTSRYFFQQIEKKDFNLDQYYNDAQLF